MGKDEKDEKMGEAANEDKAAEDGSAATSMEVDEEKKELKDESKEQEIDKSEEKEADEQPQAELTEAEKQLRFRPASTPDLTSHVLNTSFAHFSIPEEAEGFDEIRFEWQDGDGSRDYLKKWIREKKLTSRIDDLQPSEWFKAKVADFQKALQDWQAKQKDFADAKKETEDQECKKNTEDEENGVDDDENEVKKVDVDIFKVDDVCDVGDGEPLFASFTFEDWALLNLRFELHLLQAAFKHDVEDPERLGIHESHILFYYSRYFHKQLNPKSYGQDGMQEVCELVKDTVKIDPANRVLVCQLSEDPESPSYFVKLQEKCRRKRQQRIDAGDETARLNFSLLVQQQKEPQRQETPRESAAAADGAAWGGAPSGPHAPRLVPAPRSQGWQPPVGSYPVGSHPSQAGKTGKGRGGGRWQQTYAPRVVKGGAKKG